MIESLVCEPVEFMPDVLQPGVIYVSDRFETAIHLCACGCGEKTVTPTGHDGWKITNVGGLVTLEPSIGNSQFACRSHYFLRNGKIEWV